MKKNIFQTINNDNLSAMQTVTIEIINDKALRLLQELELLQLIRLRKDKTEEKKSANNFLQYKGILTKQSVSSIDNQLNELRNGWE